MSTTQKRILFFGATGTIGRATVRSLIAQGHHVVCFVRNRDAENLEALSGAELQFGDLAGLPAAMAVALRSTQFDAVYSTLASRTGLPRDAWAIDYQAHSTILRLAKNAAIPQFVLLSAICVQKPMLAFQHAKLAFEKELTQSGLSYSIVRPTAFFKSLSGQIKRLKVGKPFLMFGNGRLTACKPLSDDDLGAYLASCVSDPEKWNTILPIGGPGPAITPREQGEMIFALLGQQPRFRSVPLAVLKTLRIVFSSLGSFSQTMKDKAELVSIGLYYGTESMLLLDPETGRYDADATPSTGHETLQSYYERLIHNQISDDRGDHAVF